MNWIAINLIWPKLSKKHKRQEKKKDVLKRYVAPLRKELESIESVNTSNYTFQTKEGKPVVFLVIGFEGNAEEIEQVVKELLGYEDIKEGNNAHYWIRGVKEDFSPKPMEKIWGKDNLNTFAQMKDLMSTLAIKAINDELGESYEWHKFKNKLGHVWLNQLCCNFAEEAEINQARAVCCLRQSFPF